MANKTLLDFAEITAPLDTDVLYAIRGTAAGRDKKITWGNLRQYLAPTSHAVNASTYGLATASLYGHAKASSATPLVNGTGAVGTDNGLFAREAHVHPTDTSRAPTSHAVNASTYGLATASLYGHVKLFDVATSGQYDAITSNAVYELTHTALTEGSSNTAVSRANDTLINKVQALRNNAQYLLANALDKSLTAEQGMAGRLVVNSASIPLQASRNTNATVEDWNSLAILHQSTATTVAGMAVALTVDLKDATVAAQVSLGQIRWKRIVSGDLDTASNRQANVEFWGYNSAGSFVRQAFVSPNGLMYGNANPDASDNSYGFATTAWANAAYLPEDNYATVLSGSGTFTPVHGRSYNLDAGASRTVSGTLPRGTTIYFNALNVSASFTIGGETFTFLATRKYRFKAVRSYSLAQVWVITGGEMS